MTPGIDAIAAAPDAAPSLVGAALRTVGALVLLAGAAWVFLRWHRGLRASRRQMEVLDRAVLTRGASVAILRVEGKRLLLGISADGVRLLRELEPGAAGAGDFEAVLAEASAEKGAGA
jgi:flagellar biogenesis protein FliO